MVLVSRSVSRIAVVGSAKEGRPLLGSIRRLDILHFLASHRDAFGPKATVTMSAMVATCCPAGVVTCHASVCVRDALRMLTGNRMYGLPIVNDDGVLKAHLSVPDVEYFAQLPPAEFEENAEKPVGEFLRSRAFAAASASVYVSPFPITVRLHDCLGSVVELMAAASMKSMCVVDDAMRPVGEINVVDILREVTKVVKTV